MPASSKACGSHKRSEVSNLSWLIRLCCCCRELTCPNDEPEVPACANRAPSAATASSDKSLMEVDVDKGDGPGRIAATCSKASSTASRSAGWDAGTPVADTASDGAPLVLAGGIGALDTGTWAVKGVSTGVGELTVNEGLSGCEGGDAMLAAAAAAVGERGGAGVIVLSRERPGDDPRDVLLAREGEVLGDDRRP